MAHWDCLDFDLQIEDSGSRDYSVAVLQSPAGEAREAMHFPLGDLALENRLLTLQNVLLRSGGPARRHPSREERAVQEFGAELFDTVFVGEVRTCYAVSRSKARQQRKGLRRGVHRGARRCFGPNSGPTDDSVPVERVSEPAST